MTWSKEPAFVRMAKLGFWRLSEYGDEAFLCLTPDECKKLLARLDKIRDLRASERDARAALRSCQQPTAVDRAARELVAVMEAELPGWWKLQATSPAMLKIAAALYHLRHAVLKGRSADAAGG
jgi:hypothetical protein